MRKRPIKLKRRHDSVGISAMHNYAGSGSLIGVVYVVAVAMEAEDGPASVRGRPCSLVLFPNEARHLAEQLNRFAAEAQARTEGTL